MSSSIRPFERIARLWRSRDTGAVLARGSASYLLVQVVGMGLAFGVQILLARTMGGPEGYGPYAYALNWMMTLLVLGRVGLGTASLRFVASFVARSDWPRLRGYLRAANAAVLTSSALVGAGIAVTTLLLWERLEGPLGLTFLVAALGVPVYALVQVWSFVLRGFHRVFAAQVPPQVLQPILLGSGVGLAALLAPQSLTAPRAMAIHLGAGLGALGVLFVLLRRHTPRGVRSVEARMEIPYWTRVVGPLLLLNGLHVVLQRSDILFVGALLGEAQAGLYAPAHRIAYLIVLGLMAVSAWAAPVISDLHTRGDHHELQRLVRIAARSIFAVTFPLFLLLLFFGERVLALFGPEFVAARDALLILAGGQLVNAMVGPVGFLLTMTGRQDTAMKILVTTAVAHLALQALLVPRFGIEGSAAATALSRAGWNIAMAVAVWRRMGLRATVI